MKLRLYIDSAAERDSVAAVLSHSGYAVRQGREKPPGGTRWRHFIEYWLDEE